MKRLLRSTLVQNAGMYLTSSVTAKALPLVALPIVTSAIDPQNFGIWSVYLTILSFMVPLTGMMLHQQVGRAYYSSDVPYRRRLISNVLIVNLFMAISIILVATLALGFEANFLEIKFLPLIILPILSFFQNVRENVLTVVRHEKKPKIYFLFEVGYAAIFWSLVLTLSRGAKSNWHTLLTGSVVTSIGFAIAGVYYLIKMHRIRMALDPVIIKRALKVTVPLIPHALGGTVIGLSDRFIIEHYLGLSAVGVYSVAYSLGNSVALITSSFNRAWSPWVYEKLASNSLESKILIVQQTLRWWFILLIVLLAAFVACLLYVRFLLDVRYAKATSVFPFVLAGAFFQGLYFSIFPFLTHIGKTNVYAGTTTLSALVNLILTIALTPKFGLPGAAFATTAAYFTMFGLVLFATQIITPLPWKEGFLALFRKRNLP